MSDKNSSVSITFNTPTSVRDRLRKYALAIGATRKVNKSSDAVTGDLSKSINILLEYALANIDSVEKYRADKVARIMNSK